MPKKKIQADFPLLAKIGIHGIFGTMTLINTIGAVKGKV